MTVDAPADAASAARYLNRYARTYSAGAFATPTAKDLTGIAAAGGWHWWPQGVAAVSRRLKSPSWRADFTGRKYELQTGWQVITHLACEPGADLPDLSDFARVYAYAEDPWVTGQLRAQAREVAAVKVSAASEIIACWGRPGSGREYDPADQATLVKTQTAFQVEQMAREAAGLAGWLDDFPYYSDGSWSALSLRGFNPADPTCGIKPAEMSKAWWRGHPEAAGWTRCGWTVLAERCPALMRALEGVSEWGALERVRLLKMAGRPGKTGTLKRHTDITDRAAGTADGKIARFHIPLITHDGVTMSAWNLRGEQATAHLEQGSMWYLDARKPHAVANPSGQDRIHLVVDAIADPRWRQVITDGQDVAA